MQLRAPINTMPLAFIVFIALIFWKENRYSPNLALALIFDNLRSKKSTADLA
jgi:hypothetical protein